MRPGIDLGGAEEEESSSLEDSISLNLIEDGSAGLGLDDENNEGGDESDDNALALSISGNTSLKRKSKYNYSNRKRKCRTTFTKQQLSVLEAEFCKSNFISNDKIDWIVEQTGLDTRIIKNWFKNKRSRVLADSKQPANNGAPKFTPTLASQSLPKFNMSPLPKDNGLLRSDSGEKFNNHHHMTITSPLISSSALKIEPPKSIPNLISCEPPDITRNECQQDSSNRLNKSLNGLLDIVNSIKTDSKPATGLIPARATVRPVIHCEPCQNCGKSSCACSVSRLALSKLYRNFTGFNSTDRQCPCDGGGYQVIRRPVCHPSKQWAEQHKDLYSFFDSSETEKLFFVL